MTSARIAIVGDFSRTKHSHWATDAALFHAAARVGVTVEPQWVPTTSLSAVDDLHRLSEFDGIWGAPGSPYASMPGMLNAIRYAREHNVPYLGTCGGFQYALIEFSRNVLGILDADSAENDPDGANIVIRLASCSAPNESTSSPRLAGPGVARPTPGTLIDALCESRELAEEYFCSFETSSRFLPQWQEAGLTVAALGADGEMRAFELRQNRFFLATLFQPQLSSSNETPHPIVQGFLKASAGRDDV